ncbi:hypothetical protein F4779DRAFT_613805 [Xylariaceae sp. FL0662B]|nr:hypothetical protein F4779DRAFT_613805 [Xylariaceae sp. FL0662B]
MASKATYIPRYLLPRYGPLWRTTIRTTPFRRPLNADLGRVLVRYASKTSPKTTATKAASTKSSTTKAAKASAPKKPPPKSSTSKPAAAKAAIPKTPASPVATKSAAAPQPAVPASKPEPVPSADPAPETPAPASNTTTSDAAEPSKPIVLEKPEKFNPPSHGARLPKSGPKHYGGPLTSEEVQTQRTKSYPGLPPPPNTWAHWFIHSRSVHVFITLGTLTAIAVYSFTSRFKQTSPFADIIPPISEFPRHPLQYIGVCIDVLRMHEEHISAETAEKRKRKVDDVAKRNEYRKAHGIEPPQSFWSSKSEEKAAEPAPVVESSEPQPVPAEEFGPDGKRKKFLGIF